MSIPVYSIETGERAKPLHRCINPACGILIANLRALRCGPCAHDERERRRNERRAESRRIAKEKGAVKPIKNLKLVAGDKVYSKRCGGIGGFDGIVVEPKGNGYQVLNPKTGKTYQRDHFDLIVQQPKASDRQS